MNTIIIIGAGASGIMAAIAAARSGANVILLEQNERIGKKILATGNGRCNLTNLSLHSACYNSDDTRIVSPVLEQFNANDTISFFGELGLVTRNRDGYIYPRNDQASAVVGLLDYTLYFSGVKVSTNTKVIQVEKKGGLFYIHTKTDCLTATKLIIATGSKASQIAGSDGSGYQLAQSMGHHTTAIVPALVQLCSNELYFKKVQGVRCEAKVSLLIKKEVIAWDVGEVQLTAYGISGIPVFQVSRHAAKALYEGDRVAIELDFIPDMEFSALLQYMHTMCSAFSNGKLQQILTGLFHTKIVSVLLEKAGLHERIKLYELSQLQLESLCRVCKHFFIPIHGVNDFSQAQVCAGGIKTTEVHFHTLESNIVEGLYIIGEVLDVDGICGGYNLQWAWSSGYVAGTRAAREELYDSN